MKLRPPNRRHLVEAALGQRPVDLLIHNVRMVNVFSGEIYPAAVAVYDGFIAHVEPADPDDDGPLPAINAHATLDGEGLHLLPGLIDSHVHIESSMMTPANFARTVLPHGTTTAITDPHEIANVLGMEGIDYMLKAGADLPMRQFLLIPSCVPSVPGLETAGADFTAREIGEMLDWERVLGVAEVMDFPGVIHGNPRMVEILKVADDRGVFIQGHAPELSGRALSAYLCSGPMSDHEVRTEAEAKAKLRAGMILDARESSISRNLQALIPAVTQLSAPPNFTLCTDDREPGDLMEKGSVNHVVRRAIEEGLDPVIAIRHASLRPAQAVGIQNLGAIAPGYAADFLLAPDIRRIAPRHVFVAGQQVVRDGECVNFPADASFAIEGKNTVKIPSLHPDTFRITAPKNEGTVLTRIIRYDNTDSLGTTFTLEALPIKDGDLDLAERADLSYVGVFHRHGQNDNYALGVLGHFGLTHGAIASTVAHDCHNLTVVARNPRDAHIAASALIECGGGLVCVADGEILELLPLPVAGLMSPLSPGELAAQTRRMKTRLREMGIPGDDPLLRIATLTLAVIPEARITDRGLVGVSEQRIVPLFPD